MKWNKAYPRPSLRKPSFYSLNGTWVLNSRPIQVPFAPESELSGYRKVPGETVFTYEKDFTLPQSFHKEGNALILHFGAVDQIADVYLNDHFLIHHEGGYLPFEARIEDFLEEHNHLKLIATDTLDPKYPKGKQSKVSKGMWYTEVSGIWQSVWIESVSKTGIFEINTKLSDEAITFELLSKSSDFALKLEGQTFSFKGNSFTLPFNKLKDLRYWSPDDPYLYEYSLKTEDEEVFSYFALRKFEVKDGIIHLNGKPLFLSGVLDQGYYDKGLFLPEDSDQYGEDIVKLKELGFNFVRKHIKVEPELYYYICDRLGMLVMQDLVSSGPYSYLFDTVLPTVGICLHSDRIKDKERAEIFERDCFETLRFIKAHPSVFSLTLFNEGWGQQGTDDLYKKVKKLYPDLLIDSSSGWFKTKCSDFESKHIYFRNKVLKRHSDKILSLSECGGYSYNLHPEKGKGYGYGKADSPKGLTDLYETMYQRMVYPSLRKGLDMLVITQLSDIENEINGLFSEDRTISKVETKRFFLLNKEAYRLFRELHS